jgi:hypothetical protein
MRLEYILTLRDYKAAFRLHRRQKLTRRLLPWTGPILLLIAFIAFVIFSVHRNIELAGQAMALAAGSIVLSIGLPISRFTNIRRSFYRLFPPDAADRKSSIDIDRERIVRTLSGVSELKVLWSGVYSFVQDENVTMLYTNKDCFLFFPTQLMSSDQRAELSNLVAQHVTER